MLSTAVEAEAERLVSSEQTEALQSPFCKVSRSEARPVRAVSDCRVADLVEDAPKISPAAASKKVVAATRHTARCHSGTEKEQHRLGAPRVKALSCSALFAR